MSHKEQIVQNATHLTLSLSQYGVGSVSVSVRTAKGVSQSSIENIESLILETAVTLRRKLEGLIDKEDSSGSQCPW